MQLIQLLSRRNPYDWEKADSVLQMARQESRPLIPDNLHASTVAFIEEQGLKERMQSDVLRTDDWEPERKTWLRDLCELHAGKVRAAAEHFERTNRVALEAFARAKEAAARKLSVTPRKITRTGWSWKTGTDAEKKEHVVLWLATIGFSCLMTWTLSRMLEGTPMGKMPWALLGIPLLSALQIFIAKAGATALIESSAVVLTPRGRAKLKMAFGVASMASLASLGASLAVLSATTVSKFSVAQAASPGKGFVLASEIACEVCACAFIVYRRWKLAGKNTEEIDNPEWVQAKEEYEKWRDAEEELARLVCMAREALDAAKKVSDILVNQYMGDFRRRITEARPLPRPVIN